jgi:hypothetical protein
MAGEANLPCLPRGAGGSPQASAGGSGGGHRRDVPGRTASPGSP